VIWICEGFWEFRISMLTSDILRWTCILSCAAVDRGCGGSLDMPSFHDRDVMPVIPDVIDEVEAAESERIEKRDLSFILWGCCGASRSNEPE
jgi:hypothetical protein